MSNANDLRPGEYKHIPELGVYRAKDKTGRVDAFKSEDDAKDHTQKDPLKGLSSRFRNAGSHKRMNLYGKRVNKSFHASPKLQVTKEEVATNAVAGGAVAGLGVGSMGEPPAKKKKIKTFKRFAAEGFAGMGGPSWGSPENAANRKKLADEWEKSTYSKGKKFQAPGYKDNTAFGHHWLKHEGKIHHHDGTGTNIKTGEPAYRYTARDKDDHETSRVWVTPKGKITKD
jgi:hypothetical protein